MSHCVTVMSSFHRDLAKHNSTFFWHPFLWRVKDVPTIIADAFTTAVLYSHKTSATTQFVFRIMDKHAKTLLDTCSGEPQSQHEALARVQAMLIYQTIRAFDGDIRQRANAEAEMELFERWVVDLERFKNLQDVHGENSLLQTPQTWDVSVPSHRSHHSLPVRPARSSAQAYDNSPRNKSR